MADYTEAMKPPAPRSVPAATPLADALGRESVLVDLQRRIDESARRLQAVQGRLPPALRGQLRAGPLDENGWTLLVPSNAVAAKLRQWLPEIEAALRQAGWHLSAIRIRIQPNAGR
ncbi:MAG: hypothetical protein ACOZD0_01400 [Pseudomonadota bacterium]